ncbi:hypothetical protein [Bordetella flabilis]|uniref:Uncharacterized protein n=1 Tax=Bordetella flabilis TaxID=463014 RepID=A0A193GD19_9BORD|nr:hypothetical protein [Bordetella flabilis]ANN77518.1 hypothetical protein BAU07_10740 [Bordetella flabilis]
MKIIKASALATLMLLTSLDAVADQQPSPQDRHPTVSSGPPARSNQSAPSAPPASQRPGQPANDSQQTCMAGYIVGMFPAMNGWDDWLLWLSPTGPSWSNGDTVQFRFYSHATTDFNSGRIIYATALQAMALGQKVALVDWSGNCNGGWAESIQVWYP